MIQHTFHLFVNEQDDLSVKNKIIVATMWITMTIIKSAGKPERNGHAL